MTIIFPRRAKSVGEGEASKHSLIIVERIVKPQEVHCSSTVNIHERARKGYFLEQVCTKCTYNRHIAIKHEVDIQEDGGKAIEKYM